MLQLPGKGHYASSQGDKNSGQQANRVTQSSGIEQQGKVKTVKSIILDTGCSKALVWEDLLPVEKIIAGDDVAIGYAHVDTVLYPLTIKVDDHKMQVKVAVSSTIPMAVLGMNNPELRDQLSGLSPNSRRNSGSYKSNKKMTESY